MELRPYQIDAVYEGLDTLTRKQSCLICAPTGSGKTEIMIDMIKQLMPASVLFVTKRIKLIDQTERRFLKAGIKASVYCSSLKKKHISDITIASIDSVYKIIKNHTFNYVVFDEVHNLSEDPDSRFNKSITDLMSSGSKLIGFTATPYRRSGFIYGEGKFFNKIDYEIKFKSLIEDGYLVKPVVKCTKNEFDTSKLKMVAGDYSERDLGILTNNLPLMDIQVVEALVRLKGRNKIFWQCSNIKHAEAIVENLILKGESAVVVHSKQSNSDSSDSIEDFEIGSARHCVFVSILSEGYDYPQADALVMLRPTRSPTLYVQTVGRVLRPYPNKVDALILDFGQIVKNCGPIDKPVVFEGVRSKRNEGTILVWLCPECLTYNSLDVDACIDCGKDRKPPEKKSSVLERKPDEESSVLYGGIKEPSEYTKKVHSIYACVHQVRNSSKICYRITANLISSDGSLTGYESIKNFYRVDLYHQVQKALKIFDVLGIDREAVDQMQNVCATNVPSEATISIDGKYKRIKSVNFGKGN